MNLDYQIILDVRQGKMLNHNLFQEIEKTIDSLVCSHEFFKKWLQIQFTPDKTVENHLLTWHFDHIFSWRKFDLLDKKQMRKCFNWINLRPGLAEDIIMKSIKVDFRFYHLQEIRLNILSNWMCKIESSKFCLL